MPQEDTHRGLGDFGQRGKDLPHLVVRQVGELSRVICISVWIWGKSGRTLGHDEAVSLGDGPDVDEGEDALTLNELEAVVR